MPLPVAPEEREGRIRRFLSGLSFPKLFLLFMGLFLFDLAVPDLIPPYFIDEAILAAITFVFGMWRQKRPRSNSGT